MQTITSMQNETIKEVIGYLEDEGIISLCQFIFDGPAKECYLAICVEYQGRLIERKIYLNDFNEYSNCLYGLQPFASGILENGAIIILS